MGFTQSQYHAVEQFSGDYALNADFRHLLGLPDVADERLRSWKGSEAACAGRGESAMGIVAYSTGPGVADRLQDGVRMIFGHVDNQGMQFGHKDILSATKARNRPQALHPERSQRTISMYTDWGNLRRL